MKKIFVLLFTFSLLVKGDALITEGKSTYVTESGRTISVDSAVFVSDKGKIQFVYNGKYNKRPQKLELSIKRMKFIADKAVKWEKVAEDNKVDEVNKRIDEKPFQMKMTQTSVDKNHYYDVTAIAQFYYHNQTAIAGFLVGEATSSNNRFIKSDAHVILMPMEMIKILSEKCDAKTLKKILEESQEKTKKKKDLFN